MTTCYTKGADTVELKETNLQNLSRVIYDEAEEKIYILDRDPDTLIGKLVFVSTDSKSKGSVIKIVENVVSLSCVLNGNVYYSANPKNPGESYLDNAELYKNDELIDTDVTSSTIKQIENENVLTYETFSLEDEITLKIYDENEAYTVGENIVFKSVRSSKEIAMISNYSFISHTGDLLLYTGEDEPELIDTDVSRFVESN